MILAAALFIFTYDDFSVRDSGEFISCSKVLGITHAPGGVVFTVLGRLFYSVLGVKGVNLLSAFFGLLCVYLIYKYCGQTYTALAGGAVFLFTENMFFYSTIAETYTITLVFFLLMLYYQSRNTPLVMFSYGMSAIISPVNLILFFPFAIVPFRKEPVRAFFYLILPLPLVFYYYLRDLSQVVLTHSDSTTIKGLLTLLTGADFSVASNVLDISLSSIRQNLTDIFNLLMRQPLFYIFLICSPFIYKDLRKRQISGRSVLFCAVFVIFFTSLSLPVARYTHFFLPLTCYIYILLILFFQKLKYKKTVTLMLSVLCVCFLVLNIP
ncbi:MAG: protein O-mannosyl-transferase family, partial [Candidatus Muiribacteriaceae bacterium]